ncbi:MAG: hypothetical protein ACYCQJ_15500 [Nitrososphaerales archaeon]
MVNWFLPVGILFGTVLVLITTVAWVDLIREIRTQYPLFKNQLGSQFFYTFLISLLALIVLAVFNPLGLFRTRDVTLVEPVAVVPAVVEESVVDLPKLTPQR